MSAVLFEKVRGSENTPTRGDCDYYAQAVVLLFLRFVPNGCYHVLTAPNETNTNLPKTSVQGDVSLRINRPDPPTRTIETNCEVNKLVTQFPES